MKANIDPYRFIYLPSHSGDDENINCSSPLEHFSIKVWNSVLHTLPKAILKCWLSPDDLLICSLYSSPLLSQHHPHAFLSPLSLFCLTASRLLFCAHSWQSAPCPHLLNTTAIASQARSLASALLLIRPLTAACLHGCQAEGLAACLSAGVVVHVCLSVRLSLQVISWVGSGCKNDNTDTNSRAAATSHLK